MFCLTNLSAFFKSSAATIPTVVVVILVVVVVIVVVVVVVVVVVAVVGFVTSVGVVNAHYGGFSFFFRQIIHVQIQCRSEFS